MAFDTDPELAALLESLLHPQLKRISPGLERLERLLEALGNPHQQLPPVIHAAGTNGKGSTLAMLRAILEAAGKRVHVYTSPHLVRFNERIRVAGELISKEKLMPILQQIHALQEDYPTTFFEATTAAAFVAFTQAEADVVLLETGMGGRLDATNLIEKPLATLITPIGYDHQDFLGETLTEIAGEKAGILRAGVPAFIAAQEPEAQKAIEASGGELHWASRDWQWQAVDEQYWKFTQDEQAWQFPLPALSGSHQLANASLAVACLRKVFPGIAQAHIAQGLQQAEWPARIQRIQRPEVPADIALYLDGAHNVMAARELAKWAENLPQKPVLVLAMKSDKDARGFIENWRKTAHKLVLTRIPNEAEHVPPSQLAEYAQEFDISYQIEDDMERALHLAALEKRPIIICGSLYLAGEILAKN